MEEIEKGGLSFTIPRDQNEPNSSYYRRRMFIANLQPKTEKTFREYETYSRVFSNILSLNCRYPEPLEKKVMDLAEKGSKKKVPKSKIIRKNANKNGNKTKKTKKTAVAAKKNTKKAELPVKEI